jgi:UDP-GlcNAc:undecaprenyl-phosphate/decaprenyl-phosphate GlcNAc-1-phosphate transferase
MYLVLVFITSGLVSLFATPSLIKVAYLKRLFDMPDFDRKMHRRAVPTIGGIIIFSSTLFAYALWYPSTTVGDFKYIIVCMLVLFFVGIKDDIIGTAPMKKLIAHVIIGLILTLMANIRISSLHGLFGIYEIPEYASIFISLFTYIVIVNAFNLIDGVDGLAAGIGFIASFCFGTWFYMAGNIGTASLAFALAGSLFSFLIFNFQPARIFMGDSGSLTIGLVVSILAIKLIEQDVAHLPPYMITLSKPVFAMAVLVYPLYDTLRVFTLRAAKGNSPFSADKKHIHHRLLKVGLSHGQTAIALYAATIFLIITVVIFTMFSPTISFIGICIETLLLAQIPFMIKKKYSDPYNH